MRIKLAPCAVLAAALLTAASWTVRPGVAHAANPDRPFIFYGAGWGHGVGLSQWGAYGLAQKGWTHERILEHYYTGTSLGPSPNTPESVRVGLAWDRSSISVTAVGGPLTIRMGSANAKDRFKIPNGYTWTVRAVNGKFEIHKTNGGVETVGGPGWDLHVMIPAGSRVRLASVNGVHEYAHGYVEMNVYQPSGASTWYLRAIAVVTMQEFLYGVGEVPSSWPAAALRTQAVAARTYALNVIGSKGQHRLQPVRCNCALIPTSDGYYIGYDKETQGAAWVEAVQATAGQVVLYNGGPITATYTSSSGGYTESNENAWGSQPAPYLRAVCDPGDYTSANPNRTWTVQLTAGQIGDRLQAYGYGVGTPVGFSNVSRSVSGRILSLTVVGTSGSRQMSGRLFAQILGLREDKVWINVNRNVEGLFRTTYDAAMCKPGLPETAVQAVNGGSVQRFANGGIYLQNRGAAAVWSHGPIYDKYRSMGGSKSLVGFPTSGIVGLHVDGCPRAGSCARENFRVGRIYYKAGLGAHELHGPVYDCYLANGGAGGKLGFPTSDIVNPGNGTRYATFEHGTVQTSPTGCKVVAS